MSHISHDLSNVGSADDIYAEDGGMNDFDMSQEHSISDISGLPVYYNPRPCCHRDKCSSSSLLPSLQDINNNVDDDEVLSPSYFQSQLLDDGEDKDDANYTRSRPFITHIYKLKPWPSIEDTDVIEQECVGLWTAMEALTKMQFQTQTVHAPVVNLPTIPRP